ncbi:uncharacterized protein ARMOST_14316 [Armillaria ostoyae]|uniref:Uncharacterized protein n=1 Tax=Armillaria ostoyae TaxID=47428 RepID=A0A284RQ88_ARMOS|nr:uncharacterized protein ARMOST_14316 [Armillaria ostoyae]
MVRVCEVYQDIKRTESLQSSEHKCATIERAQRWLLELPAILRTRPPVTLHPKCSISDSVIAETSASHIADSLIVRPQNLLDGSLSLTMQSKLDLFANETTVS